MGSAILGYVLNGICIGGVYGLVSSAWSFQCGALKFANFAYGASIMLSMYITYFSIREWNIPLPIAVLIVLVMDICLGFLMRKTVLWRHDRNTQILCTMGLSLIIINLVDFVFTSYPRDFGILETRIFFTDTISIGRTQLICFVMSAVILITFQMFLSKTWTGRSIRAVVQNREVATLMGVKGARTLDLAFALSYVLIAIAGIMLMSMYQVEPAYGDRMQSIAFIVCVSAGLGNLSGAFLSGILVGVLEQLIVGLLGAQFRTPILYGLFVIILLARPHGIFTKKQNVARSI